MKTLILKTEGLSAYGLQTFDIHRRVNHFPTRSAMIGLLAAALGITRKEHNKLYELSENVITAVQVNEPGEKIVDYHTVQYFRSPTGKIQQGTKPTYREYWCDSEHTFAICTDDELATKLCEAVKSPTFTLFQGRKCCPLTRPIFEDMLIADNPAIALTNRAEQGQIFSDTQGENHIATLQIRDKLTPIFRKYAMRTVFVSGKIHQDLQEMSNESA